MAEDNEIICILNNCEGIRYSETKYCYRHRKYVKIDSEGLSICMVQNCQKNSYKKTKYCYKHRTHDLGNCMGKKYNGKNCNGKLHRQSNYCKNHYDMKDYTDHHINNINKCNGCGEYRYILTDDFCTKCAPCHGFVLDDEDHNNKKPCTFSRKTLTLYCTRHKYMNNYTDEMLKNMTVKCKNKRCASRMWKYFGDKFCEACQKKTNIIDAIKCNGLSNNGTPCDNFAKQGTKYCKVHENMCLYTDYMRDNITKCTKGHYRYCEINLKTGKRYKKCIHCNGYDIANFVEKLNKKLGIVNDISDSISNSISDSISNNNSYDESNNDSDSVSDVLDSHDIPLDSYDIPLDSYDISDNFDIQSEENVNNEDIIKKSKRIKKRTRVRKRIKGSKMKLSTNTIFDCLDPENPEHMKYLEYITKTPDNVEDDETEKKKRVRVKKKQYNIFTKGVLDCNNPRHVKQLDFFGFKFVNGDIVLKETSDEINSNVKNKNNI